MIPSSLQLLPRHALMIIFLMSSCLPAASQSKTHPSATIADVSWMEGQWRCENSWGISEESWLKPEGGSMAGIYRMTSQGKPVFYEFVTIEEVGGSLVMRLKHFSGNMKAWEEKEVTVDFPLMEVKGDELVFDGSAYKKKLTIRRMPDGSMHITMDSESKAGVKSVTVFPYERVRR